MKFLGFFLIIFFGFTVRAQNFERDFPLSENASVKITNLYGRVSVTAEKSVTAENEVENEKGKTGKAFLMTRNGKESDLKIVSETKRLEISVQPLDAKSRIDLTLKIPAGMKVNIETADGEVRLEGHIESAEIKTETGTIAANVPLDDLKYDFVWTESRPRFVSDIELAEADEKAAGKFVINGKLGEKVKNKKEKVKSEDEAETLNENEENSGSKLTGEERRANEKDRKSKAGQDQKLKTKNQKPKTIKLNFTTARGIILLNVNPNEVPANLTERPLTEAAKAIIRSGDLLLAEAIRRASPKYFGEYAQTLPPRRSSPVMSENKNAQTVTTAPIKRVVASVTDINNRAIGDLKKADFEVTEKGESREILAVEPTTAPFNLVLLLDVSGSVDNYVDFIRKTARNFVRTVGANDKIAIVIFNEDVKTLSTLTTDKSKLSESLDTFDAGGGTAFYDALAYTLAETLRPLKGERTAVVVLSDGDDNRSFLAFDSLSSSIQESGALIYPLYVPSGLIAASANNNADSSVDPLRSRYIGLTSKSEAEGAKLAQTSGGVYYPITQISDLQKAYDDIVVQLRTAYSITYRSNLTEFRENRASPRLKVKVKRENSFVKLGSVVEISEK
ncbi:MAG: VWA domain-containing protein [Pyrinomonadaceae bacterium]|nr:VWA domain-containing protein [Pyrinomonadaceae bacterium]